MLGEGRGWVLMVRALSGGHGVRGQGRCPPETHSQGNGRRTQGWLHYAQPRGGEPGPCKRCTTREGCCEAGFLGGILSESSSSESPRIPLLPLRVSMCTTAGFCAQREAGSPSAVHQLLCWPAVSWGFTCRTAYW